MKKIALILASMAGLGFTAPSFAMDNSAPHFSVRVGQPSAHGRVIVRDHDRGYHRAWRDHDRGYHNGWRNHRGQSDRVVIVKKHQPAKKVVIINR